VKFAAGTRRLGWLADPQGPTPDDRLGPVAVELREPHSTTYTEGVLTLVPVAHLEAATYDYANKVASLTVKGLKAPLTGSLEYRGVNVLGLAGTAGTAGKAAVKAVTFPDPRPVPKRTGPLWAVQIAQPAAENPTLQVRNLKVLYRLPGGGEQLADTLQVRKGPPLSVNAELKRFELLAKDPNTGFAAAEVETTSGPERVVAIPLAADAEKKAGALVGFVGEVDAGYKLFPLHTVKVIKPYVRKVD
jgi:hypothetical protein